MLARAARVRRVTVAAVLATLLGILALAPGSSSGALERINVLDFFFDPDDVTFQVTPFGGPNFVWDWGGMASDSTANEHNVVHKRGLFDSGSPTDTRDDFGLNVSAGKYPYFCEVHRFSEDMKGRIRVPPVITDGTEDSAKVHWAGDTTETGKRFDVRYRVDGGKWQTWRRDTKKFKGNFGRNDKPVAVDFAKHDYEVSARSEKGKPSKKKRSGYSPPVDLEP